MKNLEIMAISLLLLLLATTCLADTRLGFLGGPILSDFSSKTLDSLRTDFSSRTGLGLGGVIDLGAEGPLGLRLEPQYVRKGADKTFYHPWFGEISSQVDLTYIELPVLLKYTLDFDGPRIFAAGGGWIGYLLDAQEEFQCDLGRELFGDSRDVKEDMESTDYGYTFGAGVSLPIGSSRLFLEGRYARGLQDIWSGDVPVEDPEFEEGTTELETGGWRIQGGITFPIGAEPKEYFNDQPSLPTTPPDKPPAKPADPLEGYDAPGARDDEKAGDCSLDIDIHLPKAQDPSEARLTETEDATRGAHTLVNDDIDDTAPGLRRNRIRNAADLRSVTAVTDLKFEGAIPLEDDLVRIDLFNPQGLSPVFLNGYAMACEDEKGEKILARRKSKPNAEGKLRFWRNADRTGAITLPLLMKGKVESFYVEGLKAGRFRLVLFHMPQGTLAKAAQVSAIETGDPNETPASGQVELEPACPCRRNVRLTVAKVDIRQVWSELPKEWRREDLFDVFWNGRALFTARLWPSGGRYRWGVEESLPGTWIDGKLRKRSVRSAGKAPSGGKTKIVDVYGGFAHQAPSPKEGTKPEGSAIYQHRLELDYQVEGVTFARREPVTIMVPAVLEIASVEGLERGFNQPWWGSTARVSYKVDYRLSDQTARWIIGPGGLHYENRYGARLQVYEALGMGLNAFEKNDNVFMTYQSLVNRARHFQIPIETKQRSNAYPKKGSLSDGTFKDYFTLVLDHRQNKPNETMVMNDVRVGKPPAGSWIFAVSQDVVALLNNGLKKGGEHDIVIARGNHLIILGPKAPGEGMTPGQYGPLGFQLKLGSTDGTELDTGEPVLVGPKHNPPVEKKYKKYRGQ